MASAPQDIWDLWYAIEAKYNGPGLQDEELAGIVGNREHSFGYHLAPNELPASDYSLQTSRDRAGAAKYPGDASALDVHFGPAGMVTVTKRLVASAKDPNDPRLDGLYEFCGTTNGVSPHPFTVWTGRDDPSNTQGWDYSHVTHVHMSILRDVSHDFAALAGIADVIAGTTTEDDMPFTDADAAVFWGHKIDKNVGTAAQALRDARQISATARDNSASATAAALAAGKAAASLAAQVAELAAAVQALQAAAPPKATS